MALPRALRGLNHKVVDTLISSVRIPPANRFDFITVTLNPKFCNFAKTAIRQFNMTINDLRSMLNYIAEDYCLKTELTEQCNVHYHLWIEYKKDFNIKYFISAMRENDRFGFIYKTKIKYNKSTAQQQQDAYNYLIKDMLETYKILRTQLIVLNASDNIPIQDFEVKE